MSRVIAGDYGGVFGLERPGRVFRDWAGRRCLGGGLLGSIVQEFRGLCFFCSAGTLTYNKKKIWGAPRQPVIF